MKYIILISAALFIIIGCSAEQKKEKPLILQIKTLEYSRERDVNRWKSLYKKASSDDKITVINSIAMLKDKEFIPFLDSVLTHNADEKLRQKVIFALGQTHSDRAEAVLLREFNSGLPQSIKISIIRALSHCGSERCIPDLQAWVNHADLKEETVKTAAILAHKKIKTNSFRKTVLNDSLSGCAYYLYYAHSSMDFSRVVEWLSSAQGAEQKYLLKWLVKDYERRGRYFKKSAMKDSLYAETVEKLIQREKDWRNQYYALQLISTLEDSIKEPLLEPYFSSKNPHLRLQAYKEIAKTNDQRIPELLGREKEWALKGELLKLLAKSRPGIAYGMIMENLDQGTDYFKIKLLQALNMINDRMSRQTISQFLFVDNSRLANAAFDILKKRRRISNDDADMLLDSGEASTAAAVIGWKNADKKRLKIERLLDLYAKFRSPESFDVQVELLKNLQLNAEKPRREDVRYLYKNAANRRVVENLNQWLSLNSDTLSEFVLPQFLNPDSIMSADTDLFVHIKTAEGVIKLELLPQDAPLTVYNFLYLVKKGFYDGLTFHRVVADFVIQGGDPQGDGWGGPGYLIPSEDNEAPFRRGSVGMATSGFDTGGSQFFICQSDQPHLDGNYTLFAEVIAGMDVVDRILPDDKIIKITVRKKQ